jgi:asparagine synthase (glutamine-hydrolysing)
MCGIVFAKLKHLNSDSIIKLNKLLNSQNNRGPDNTSSKIISINGSHFFLGHNRLNIVDNNQNSNQPYEYEGNYLLFNGEIYNLIELRSDLKKHGYVLTTTSDTEIIIKLYHKYGIGFVDKLKGMYSIILLDSDGSYYCIRDPNGIKPLYSYLSKEIEAYASNPMELARCFELRLRYDLKNLLNEVGYLPMGLTPWREIESVKTFQLSNTLIINNSEDLIESEDNIFNFINKIIKEQYKSITDVGVLCSGGIDSSYIAKIGLDNNLLTHAYFINYPDARKENEYQNVNKLFKKHQSLLEIINIDDNNYIKYLDQAIDSMPIPNFDSAIIPQAAIAERASSLNTKVLLSGIGADEIFMGYSKYSHPIRKFISKNRNIMKYILNKRVKSPTLDMLCATMGDGIIKHFQLNYNNLIIKQDELLMSYPSNLYQHADIKNYLTDILLLNYDQILMNKSIEGRAPFIDTRIYELFLKNKNQVIFNNFKSSMKTLLLKDIDYNFENKEGFSTPSDGFRISKEIMRNYLRNNFGLKYAINSSLRTLTNSYIINRWLLINGFNYE